MAINNFEELNLNAIDVLNKRETKFLPIHFKSTVINEFNTEKVRQWIKSKLRGRFCIQRIPQVNDKDKLGASTVVAFEDEKELTYFMLASPYTRRT